MDENEAIKPYDDDDLTILPEDYIVSEEENLVDNKEDEHIIVEGESPNPVEEKEVVVTAFDEEYGGTPSNKRPSRPNIGARVQKL